MTQQKSLLIGKWELVKAEKHNGSEWKPIDHVKGMEWEFHPEYISAEKTIGVITERAPGVEPVKLDYIYDLDSNFLHIKVYTDPVTRIKDETDIYLVQETDQTIVIELINQIGHPAPYLRYSFELAVRS